MSHALTALQAFTVLHAAQAMPCSGADSGSCWGWLVRMWVVG